jgi:hypothetical protein
MREKGWVTSYQHGSVGKMDVFGLPFDLSDTPGVVQGHGDEQINTFLEQSVAMQAPASASDMSGPLLRGSFDRL